MTPMPPDASWLPKRDAHGFEFVLICPATDVRMIAQCITVIVERMTAVSTILGDPKHDELLIEVNADEGHLMSAWHDETGGEAVFFYVALKALQREAEEHRDGVGHFNTTVHLAICAATRQFRATAGPAAAWRVFELYQWGEASEVCV